MPNNPDDLKKSFAVHEAGHIVIAIAIQLPFKYGTIKKEGTYGGHVLLDNEEIVKQMDQMDYQARVNFLIRVASVACAGKFADIKLLRLLEEVADMRAAHDFILFDWLAEHYAIEPAHRQQAKDAAIASIGAWFDHEENQMAVMSTAGVLYQTEHLDAPMAQQLFGQNPPADAAQ